MKYKGIIFDLDGVLCHTDRYHYLAWKKIADQLGIEFDERKNERLRGISRQESMEIILEDYVGTLTDEDIKKYIAEKNEIYKELLKNMSSEDLSLEVKSTLDELRQMGLRMAVGSSSKNAKYILEKIGLKDFFDAVSDGTNITRSKPDPEVFLMAADMLSVAPRECLVVEDAIAGLQSAKAGGMDCAAVETAVLSDIADYSLHSFKDLKKIICN